MKYTIKEVSEKTGISSYVLRYYEKEGLLPPVSRSKGGIRVYTDSELEQLGLISCLKNTGMPLKDIRTFVQLQAEGPSTLRKRCEILRLQQEHVQQDIEKLQKTYEKVSHKLAHFSQQLETYERENRHEKRIEIEENRLAVHDVRACHAGLHAGPGRHSSRL